MPDEPLRQFKPCGHFACSHCVAMFANTDVEACYVCDVPFKKPDQGDESSTSKKRSRAQLLSDKLEDMAASSAGLTSQAHRVKSTFDATIAASNRSLTEYVHSINRIRAKLDEAEGLAKLRIEEFSRISAKHRDEAVNRIQAGQRHAQIFSDLSVVGDFLPPDCSFAARIVPDEKCPQLALDHEAVLAKLAASSREYAFQVDITHSSVTFDGSILRQRPTVKDIPHFMTVDAKTASNMPVEDLAKADVVLQLLDTETDVLLPEYNCRVVIEGPGICSILCSLPMSFSRPSVRARLYVREVELIDAVVRNAFMITGVVGIPVRMEANCIYGFGAAYEDNIYLCDRGGHISVKEIASGRHVRGFQLVSGALNIKQFIISSKGHMYVLSSFTFPTFDPKLLIFSLEGDLLGSIPATFEAENEPMHFDLYQDDLLIVFPRGKVVHMKMKSCGLEAVKLKTYDLGYHSGLQSVRVLPNHQGFVAKSGSSAHLQHHSFTPGQPSKAFETTATIRCMMPCDEQGKEVAVFNESSRFMQVIDITTGTATLTTLMPFHVETVFRTASTIYAMLWRTGQVAVALC